jgi:ribonuclease D
VRQLDDEGRGILKELYLFRERQARSENRPTFRVISNQALVSLSGDRPQSWRGLQQIKGISYRMAKRYGQEMLAAIRRGAQNPIPWGERPRPENGSGRNGRPSPEAQARFEALRSWRNVTAEARGVEPDLVLTNHFLWAIAQRNPRHKRDLSGDGLLARWQVDEFGDELLAIVKRVS